MVENLEAIENPWFLLRTILTLANILYLTSAAVNALPFPQNSRKEFLIFLA
jgi:hypothetical protein